ncbi:MAG: quinolinate synthase NadA [Phycisphaerae bacterium]|nr:quinolinate synthase NadA [Phycisphaerae bacterium]
MYQIPLPAKYQNLSPAEASAIIRQCRDQLGSRLVILGHHYQRDEIIEQSDFIGDSLKLSQIAAAQKDAEFIVFCGVHFMAESADILSSGDQKVLLPDMTAGCSMADMADLDQVEQCWATLREHLGDDKTVIPVTYVNSTAAIKAFCGRHDGLCCTSSNCREVLASLWGHSPDAIILFLPDQHLGRNTAYQMGVPLDAMCLWDPYESDGGLVPSVLRRSRVILWDGFCSVHQGFTVEQIARVRAEDPTVRVIVHPECPFDVVQQADASGSTGYIVKAIEDSSPGTHWRVGTEMNLVNRLKDQMAEKGIQVQSLSDCPCLCETMYRIDLNHLAWLLAMLVAYVDSAGTSPLHNQIIVPDGIKQDAVKALNRMLNIG